MRTTAVRFLQPRSRLLSDQQEYEYRVLGEYGEGWKIREINAYPFSGMIELLLSSGRTVKLFDVHILEEETDNE
jgi:hypothetical protein